MFNLPSYADRHMSIKGIYEYGSRAGVWRILREFEQRQLPLTVFAVTTALEYHPELGAHLIARGHEIACHVLRWINYQTIPEALEREYLQAAIERLQQLIGHRLLGWYTGRSTKVNKN